MSLGLVHFQLSVSRSLFKDLPIAESTPPPCSLRHPRWSCYPSTEFIQCFCLETSNLFSSSTRFGLHILVGCPVVVRVGLGCPGMSAGCPGRPLCSCPGSWHQCICYRPASDVSCSKGHRSPGLGFLSVLGRGWGCPGSWVLENCCLVVLILGCCLSCILWWHFIPWVTVLECRCPGVISREGLSCSSILGLYSLVCCPHVINRGLSCPSRLGHASLVGFLVVVCVWFWRPGGSTGCPGLAISSCPGPWHQCIIYGPASDVSRTKWYRSPGLGYLSVLGRG